MNLTTDKSLIPNAEEIAGELLDFAKKCSETSGFLTRWGNGLLEDIKLWEEGKPERADTNLKRVPDALMHFKGNFDMKFDKIMDLCSELQKEADFKERGITASDNKLERRINRIAGRLLDKDGLRL